MDHSKRAVSYEDFVQGLAQNQRKPGLPWNSIKIIKLFQILSVRIQHPVTDEVNKELVQFSRYDPWHATVYFGIILGYVCQFL